MADIYSTRPWRVAEPTPLYKNHSTKKSLKLKKSNRVKSVRWASVQTAIYPPLQDSGLGGRRVPWLNLRGHWLDRAGFNIGARFRIVVSNGTLTLKASKSGTQD